jgi:serine/threonine-protein kinase HipA
MDKSLIKKGVLLQDITPLDRLSLIGKNGMGALEYYPQGDTTWVDNVELNLSAINQTAQKILTEDGTQKELNELRSLNGDSCGARPKIIALYDRNKQQFFYDDGSLDSDLESWIVKFPSSSDGSYAVNIEYAYSLMARACGIEMSETALFHSDGKDFFGTRRFDRIDNKKIHVHTLSGILCSDHRNVELDYENLIQVVMHITHSVKEAEKAFRLACFNVLSHNRDDHGKNFALSLNCFGEWKFAPAYDLTFSDGPAHWQSMSVMGEGKNPTSKDLFKLAKKYDIKNASNIFDEVCSGLAQWEQFADEAKIPNVNSLHVKKWLTQAVKK